MALTNGKQLNKDTLNDILITIGEQNGWNAFREGEFKIIIGDMNHDISRHFGKDLQAQSRKFYIDIVTDSNDVSCIILQRLSLHNVQLVQN